MRPPSMNDDSVGVFQRGKPVGDGEHRHAGLFHQLFDGALNQPFRGVVQRRGGFIQNQNVRLPQKDSGNGNALLLSARQVGAAFGQNGVDGVRETVHKLPETGFVNGPIDFLLRGLPLQSITDVFIDGPGNEKWILRH